MGWLMPLIMALFIIGNWFHAGNTERAIKNTDEQQRQQQVYEILRLTNAINDWKYHHPGDIREGKMLTVNETGFAPVYGTKHIFSGQRTFVWLPFQPGLISALNEVSRNSALIAQVRDRKLLDNQGNNIGVPPSVIPENAIVLIN